MSTPHVTVASLFSGIGLLDLGLHRAGMTTAAWSVLARRLVEVDARVRSERAA